MRIRALEKVYMKASDYGNRATQWPTRLWKTLEGEFLGKNEATQRGPVLSLQQLSMGTMWFWLLEEEPGESLCSAFWV